MIPWIQVYSNLPQHPKTTKLADELGLASAALNPNVLAVGLVVSLWTWAIQNAYNGDLSGCSQRAIAEACLWKKKPETLVKALQKAGFLDADMKLHDWEEYACLLVEQEENRRAKTRDRVRKHREKKMEGLYCAYCGDKATGYDHIVPVTKGGTDDADNLVPCCPDCNREKNNRLLADFLNTSRKMRRNLVEQNEQLMRYVAFENGRYIPQCVTLRNASTIPDHTIPDITIPDYLPTVDNHSFSGGGDDARAQAREEVNEFCQGRDLEPGVYFGMTEEIKAAVKAFADALFAKFTTRRPTEADEGQVFQAIHDSWNDGSEWHMRLPQARKELLMYAFENASAAGKPGDWKYINGILEKLHQRNIRTLAEAEEYDINRELDRGWTI